MKKLNKTLSKTVLIFVFISVFSLTYSIHNCFGQIVIDGNIGDKEWDGAQEFKFSSNNPKADVVALVKWDENYFYFACKIADPNVQGKYKEGIQNVWEDDDVEYYLETDNKKTVGRSVNSYQLLFSAGGAYNDTGGDGNSFDFNWNSHVEYVVGLEPGTTINNGNDTDIGWHVESRLPWSDMKVDGNAVKGLTMGWNILLGDQPEGAPISWSQKVNGFANNHSCDSWGDITFDASSSVESKDKLCSSWGTIKSRY
jgi:hypothetical protein